MIEMIKDGEIPGLLVSISCLPASLPGEGLPS